MPAEIQGSQLLQFPNGTTSTTNYNLILHDNLIVHVLQYPTSGQCLQKSKAPNFSSSQMAPRPQQTITLFYMIT